MRYPISAILSQSFLLLLIPAMTMALEESLKLKIISKILDLSGRSVPDFLVYQKVSNDSISYITPKGLVTIFVQNSTQDENKPVVILDSGEDRLLPSPEKSIYVALRKTPVKNMYWVLLTYIIRNESNATLLELDSWNDWAHSSHYNKANLFGWTKCRSSNIIPCKTHSSPQNEQRGPAAPLISFQESQNYLAEAPFPVLPGNIRIHEFFSDILPLDSSGLNAKLVGEITHALVFARSMYARLLKRYRILRLSVADIEDSESDAPTSLCEESNDLDTNNLCTEIPAKLLKHKHELISYITRIDSILNGIGAMELNSTVENLLSEGYNISKMNKVGQQYLEGLLDKPLSSEIPQLNRGRRSTDDKLDNQNEVESEGSKDKYYKSVEDSPVFPFEYGFWGHADDIDYYDIEKPGTRHPYSPALCVVFPHFCYAQSRKKRSVDSKGKTGFRIISSAQLKAAQRGRTLNTETALFSNVAWATNKFYSGLEDDELMSSGGKNNKTYFKGIGGCGLLEGTLEDLENLRDPKDIAKFHMKILGTHCIAIMEHEMMNLIEKEHVKIARPANTFEVHPNFLFKTKRKLTSVEMEVFSRAVELEAYSKNLYIFFTIKDEAMPKHGRFQFIKMFAFDYISTVRNQYPHHSIKLQRNLLRTLQSLFVKALQDIFRAAYEFCEDCGDRESRIQESTREPREFLGLILFIASNDLKAKSLQELYWEHIDWAKEHEEHISEIMDQFISSLQSYSQT